MPQAIIGLKIREKRKVLGIKQNDLARRVGISPPYLNLIERNKRGIGGGLLKLIGRELDMSVDELTGTRERRLSDQLMTLAEDATLGSAELRAQNIEEFVARYPAWANALAQIFAAVQAAETEIGLLSDRLAHDPVLADAVHGMLTEITALRSTAEILNDPHMLEPAQRRRFEKIVDEQSERLAGTCAALAGYFDKLSEINHPLSALEEAEDHLHFNDAYDALEDIAQELRSELDTGGQDLELALRQRLGQHEPPPTISDRATRLGGLVRDYVSTCCLGHLEDIQRDCPAKLGPDVDQLARQRLAGAILWPKSAILALGDALAWDVAKMVAAADGDSALIFRRIAELHRSGVPRAGLICADASGMTIARAGALDLLPRARNLECPLWPLHRAAPHTIVQARVRVSGGATRIVVAYARLDAPITDMLVFTDPAHISHPPDLAQIQAGASCRVCAIPDCASRRVPSILEL